MDKKEDKKPKKPVEKKKKRFLVPRPPRKSTVLPSQDDSESLPSNHMYLGKGYIWTQEVDLFIIQEHCFHRSLRKQFFFGSAKRQCGSAPALPCQERHLVFFTFSFMKHGMPCCWRRLVVELGGSQEQRLDTSDERSTEVKERESERTKRKGENLHLVPSFLTPHFYFTS